MKKRVKQTKRARVKRVITIDTMEKLLSVIRSTWPDKCSPGIVLSRLKGGEFYGSVARYANFADQKQVMFWAKSETLEGVIRELGHQMLNKVNELADLQFSLLGEVKIQPIQDPLEDFDNDWGY